MLVNGDDIVESSFLEVQICLSLLRLFLVKQLEPGYAIYVLNLDLHELLSQINCSHTNNLAIMIDRVLLVDNRALLW